MEDIFSKAIATANHNTVCLDQLEVSHLQQFIAQGSKRLNVVKSINQHKNAIVSEAISGMINDYPSLTQPGGNCYPNRRMGNVTSDLEILLRYVTYAIAAGDLSVLKEKCFGLKDTFKVLGVPLDPTLRAFDIMRGKTIELLRSDASTEDTDLLQEVSEAFKLIVDSIR